MAEDDTSDRKGMSRRQLIRAAAATGVAAWTAPVIVGSIASPAAAASPVCNGTVCDVNSPAGATWYGFRLQDPSTACGSIPANASRCANIITAMTTLGATLNGGCPPGTVIKSVNDNVYVVSLPATCGVAVAGTWPTCSCPLPTSTPDPDNPGNCVYAFQQCGQDISHLDVIVCCK
jgi:hypothetical protein